MRWLSMSEAAKAVGPRKAGRPTHEVTVREWCLRGLEGSLLKSEFRGGVRVTRADWIEEFFGRVHRAKERKRRAVGRQAADRSTPARRKRQRQKAKQQLEAENAR